MDQFLKSLNATQNYDLMICENGCAYQLQMGYRRVPYGDEYMAKVDSYEDSDIARRVIDGRCALLKRHLAVGSNVLDYGAGSGSFVKAANSAGYMCFGFDVMPQAISRLQCSGLFATRPEGFDAVTAWDTIEHMETPSDLLNKLQNGAYLFLSIPIFDDLLRVRDSKHYRPGEHLYYWTDEGFITYMDHYRYTLLEKSTHEVDAGRESIGAYAFMRRTD